MSAIFYWKGKKGIDGANAKGKRWGREIIYGTDKGLLHKVFSKYYAKKCRLWKHQKIRNEKRNIYYRYNKWIDDQKVLA